MDDTRDRRDMFDAIDQLIAAHDIGSVLPPRPEQVEHLRARMIQRASADPLVRRWLIENARQDRPVIIAAPWEALAEQRAMAGMIAKDCPPLLNLSPIELPVEARAVALATQMWMSQTFLWSFDLFKVVQSCPMPKHVITSDALPFPFVYHSFEAGIQALHGSTHEVMGMTDWILQCYTKTGINVAVPVQSDVLRINHFGIPFGKTYPDDIPEESRQMTAVQLSMLAFLRSPYATVEARKLPRQFRRGDGIAVGTDAIDKVVNVVELRRAAKDAMQAYAAESRDFRHRWWVAGHFRSQWYPSTKRHEVIWIAPHLKGDEGAPMLDKVYAVRR